MNLLVVSCDNQLITVYIAYKYSNNDGDHEDDDDDDADDEDDDDSMSRWVCDNVDYDDKSLPITTSHWTQPSATLPLHELIISIRLLQIHSCMINLVRCVSSSGEDTFSAIMCLLTPSTLCVEWGYTQPRHGIKYTHSLHGMGLYPSSAGMGRCFNETQLKLYYTIVRL